MKTGRNMIQQEDKAHTMQYFPPDQEKDELNISYRSTLWNMVEHELLRIAPRSRYKRTKTEIE